MSSVLPAGWGINTNDGSEVSSRTTSTGVWDLDNTVNPETSITCVELPFFSKDRPMQGTKAARDSLIKLLAGMNNDVSPLNWREETEKDRVTPDPYYAVAPGWSTLSGGRRPYIHMSPIYFIKKLKRAANCVPLIRAVRVFVVDAQGNKRQVSVEELMAMNIELQQVPNLYARATAAPPAAGSTISHNETAVNAMMQRQAALEEQLAAMQALMKQVAATSAAAAAAAPSAPAPAPNAAASAASTSASAPAASVAQADNVDEEDEPVISDKRRSKKRARVV